MQMSHFDYVPVSNTRYVCENWHEHSIIVNFLSNATAYVLANTHIGTEYSFFSEETDIEDFGEYNAAPTQSEYFMNPFCENSKTNSDFFEIGWSDVDMIQRILEILQEVAIKNATVDETRQRANDRIRE